MAFVQAGEVLDFTGRDSSDFWFSCVDFKVIWDPRLSMCEKMVFTVICTHVNVRTRECPLKVKTIADEAGCSVRSVQEALKKLVEYGVIERIERFENGKQKASVYKIIGHRAPYYRGAHSAGFTKEENARGAGGAATAEIDASMGAHPAPIVGSFTPRGATDDTPSLRESNIYEIKDNSPSERGIAPPETATPATSPSGKTGTRSETPRNETDLPATGFSATEFPAESPPDPREGDLIVPDEAPAAMRETVDYFLLKTGRTGIRSEELSALRALEEIHTPARVNKEIAQAVERFGRNGRALSTLTLVYIYKSLQYQNSFKHIQGKSPPQTNVPIGEFCEAKENDPYAGAYL